MAGGMGRSGRETLAQRTANTRAAAEPRPPVEAAPMAPETAPPPTIRHCWVTGDHGRLPGLLLGWEQRPDSTGGWHGRVVHPIHETDGWIVVEEWLPADRLEPVSAPA